MEKFKQALIQFANSNPNFTQNNATDSSTLIQQRFSQFFPDFHTPNHPPYAAMIHKAIWELSEKGGSSEESISKYIVKEYPDLPWAHATLLKHHLAKLCDGKEICIDHKQRYSFVAVETDIDPISSSAFEKALKTKRDSKLGKKDKEIKSGMDLKSGKTSSKQQRKKREKSKVDMHENGIDIMSSSKFEKPLKRKRDSELGKKDEEIKSGMDLKSGKTSSKQQRKKNEKQMADMQETDIDPISSSAFEKALKRKRDFELGKKDEEIKSGMDLESGKTSSKQQCKKNEKQMADMQETDKQITVQNDDVQPLNEMDNEREVDSEIANQAEKALSITDFDVVVNGNEVEANLKQNNEDTRSDIQIQEENNEDTRCDIQIREENNEDMRCDIQIHEENNEDEQVQITQILQLEKSLDSSISFQRNGKRICTRSQKMSILNEDESATTELANPPTYANSPEEKENPTEVKKQTPSEVSTQINEQRAKLRGSQKNTELESMDFEQRKLTSPSSEMQLIEVSEPKQVQETGSNSAQDPQPETPKDETQENKPKKKIGRPKKSRQSGEKCKVRIRFSKRKQVENERLGKFKPANKKKKPKNKRHKMTRRSNRTKSEKLKSLE